MNTNLAGQPITEPCTPPCLIPVSAVVKRRLPGTPTFLLPLLLLVLLTLPAVVQAQFSYTAYNGRITITGYTGPGGVVAIPDTINGLPVTTIGVRAFRNRSSLTSVTIPNSVTSIGIEAFRECSSLTNVTIGNGVTSIGDWAFEMCRSLTSVNIPNSVTTIGTNAFYYCDGLITVTIGNSVTSIGNMAFYQCYRLRRVRFWGNAPIFGGQYVFPDLTANGIIFYYLPGTTGWGYFAGRQTWLWELPYPVILSFGPSFGVKTNGFGFIISWRTSSAVVVEACTDLAQPVWSPVATNTLSDGVSYFSDPQWTNYPNRFYRVRSL